MGPALHLAPAVARGRESSFDMSGLPPGAGLTYASTRVFGDNQVGTPFGSSTARSIC